ncbi:MAG: HlyC/CorC family transporter [Candidatus Diapherotrites archaeon]|uniref:HlyC/CorC family transporter n=1 Tax=Candidatus Iainarchaeum sp. TaxID=3101447 RepID=A0A8T5GDF8_9ARCH|nr:HlyC/CorC family transporter [Candidatus Diapherotrites archaeon]
MIEEILLLVILLALSALFSSSETAFYSVNRFKVEKLVKKKAKGSKKLELLKARQNKVLITILVMNNVINIGAASLAAALTLEIFPGNMALAISTFVMTTLILIFGEITPKSYATKHSEKMALAIAPILYYLMVVLSPITWVLDKITKLLVGKGAQETLTEEEVKLVVSLGHAEGAIDKGEKEIIHNVFRLDDINVEDIMTHRIEMETVEEDQTLKQIKQFIKKTPYSKLPVVDEGGEVIGIFNTRKAMDFLGRKLNVKVTSLMDEPFFVPTTKKIGVLLKEFQDKKVHIAIVVGDHGGTLGLITLEDILEELVGEIIEAKDDEHEIKVLNEKTIIVEGGTELNQINDELELNLKSKEFNTIAGFLLEKLDRFPEKGESFTINKAKYDILKAKKQKIEEVKITKQK